MTSSMQGERGRAQRFFVEVRAKSAAELRRLRGSGLDLFSATARESGDGEFTIDGLLTLDEIGRLVADAYPVLVTAPLESRARAAREVSEFDEWLAQRRKR